MTLATIIQARFLEAADTDDRLPSAKLKPSEKTGFWPGFEHSFEDMVGWGAQRLREEREMRFKRLPPSMAAINRHGEVMEWVSGILENEEHRRLVWAWAFAIVRGRSFSRWCRTTGRLRQTALRRLDKAFWLIERDFRGKFQRPTLPDERWLLQICPSESIVPDMMAVVVDEPHKAPKTAAWHSPGERPTDLLVSEDAVASFERFLAKVNRRRRSAQQRYAAQAA